jgi:hypothetical protein
MKVSIKLSIAVMICTLMSCQAKKDINNVVLTDFTKELISIYINDPDNLKAKNRRDEIIIVSVADTLYYYLSIFSNDSKSYKYCRNDFVGQVLYLGHSIRVFGNENFVFYSVKAKIKQQRCNDNYTEYDPLIWQVCLDKDLSFCKMRTYKITVNEDISTIQRLAEKYFKVSDTINEKHENEVYQSHEVENSPKFTLGEDSLKNIISSNFRIRKKGYFDKVPIVVGIIVDKNGKATFNGIIKSSNDIELDNEAVRVTEKICQYEFIPASHRGKKVNAVYPVVFLINDIVL